MKILVPKRWISVAELTGNGNVRPLLFFAGPVRGGGNWQVSMAKLVSENPDLKESVIACPCRWNNEHPLARHFMTGPENFFPRQLNWEWHYLDLAGTYRLPGCIIFWLACESKSDPHPGPEPYSMDTRGELGEWRMRMKYENARVVIGAEPGYHGLSQIQRNFSLTLGRDFPIYGTMQEIVEAAAKMAFRDV